MATYSESNRATYSPEDNKIRLYVGRVPRDEYLKLRSDGWTSTPKQGCDFVATWTPSRRDMALEYAGIIEDEDMGPDERAADRAERFGEYRDKRTSEAVGHADRFDSGPSVHGYQSQARADRAAARHDRIGNYACDAWSKAEYWQRRTAGVIKHALYKSTPGVRMGRIKTLEADLCKARLSLEEYGKLFRDMQKLSTIPDLDRQTDEVRKYLGSRHVWAEYMHPRLETVTNARLKEYPTSLYTLLTMVGCGYGSNDITGAEACALFFSTHKEPDQDTDWTRHLELRLAYENQMLTAQGGRLEQFEVVPGGKLGGKLILKVSKSTATGRATSADVLGPRVSGWAYKTSNLTGTDWAAYKFDLERLDPSSYTPPTPESLAELAEVKAKIKAGMPKSDPCPLINPTDADADRLQAIWNQRAMAEREAAYKRLGYKLPVTDCEPQAVLRMTQAAYSAVSKGTYARANTGGICPDGIQERTGYGASHEKTGKPVCQVRRAASGNYSAQKVIVITDKPQKPFPASVWEKHTAQNAPSEAITCSSCEQTTPRQAWEVISGHLVFGVAMECPHCQMQHPATNEARTDSVAGKPSRAISGRDSRGLSYSVNV